MVGGRLLKLELRMGSANGGAKSSTVIGQGELSALNLQNAL